MEYLSITFLAFLLVFSRWHFLPQIRSQGGEKIPCDRSGVPDHSIMLVGAIVAKVTVEFDACTVILNILAVMRACLELFEDEWHSACALSGVEAVCCFSTDLKKDGSR
jgi:hypothetical protein